MKFYGVYVPSLLGEATIGFHLKAHLKSSSSSTYRKKERKKKTKKNRQCYTQPGDITHNSNTKSSSAIPKLVAAHRRAISDLHRNRMQAKGKIS